MSTYNGEKYLKEQIDSILAQKDVDVTLYISDDCSKDNTVKIIQDYQENHKNIILHQNEKNKNFTYNFLDSLFEFKDNDEFDYYAFSDQDDVWLDKKLISGIRKIEQSDTNALYCSNLRIVDENLKQYDIMNKKIKLNDKYERILTGNIATGCTMILNKGMKNIATIYRPDNIYLHDYWLAIIACFTENCKFIYSKEDDFILYRQHSNNLIGQGNNGKFKKLKKIVFGKYNYDRSTKKLVDEYKKGYCEIINKKYIKTINKISNYHKFHNKLYFLVCFKSMNKLRFRIKILFNKY